jgi:hypothetical protein
MIEFAWLILIAAFGAFTILFRSIIVEILKQTPIYERFQDFVNYILLKLSPPKPKGKYLRQARRDELPLFKESFARFGISHDIETLNQRFNTDPNGFLVLAGTSDDGTPLVHGFLVIRWLKSRWKKPFLDGKLSGSDIEPHMLTSRRSALAYLSLVEALNPKVDGHILRGEMNDLVSKRLLPDGWIVTKPTTQVALNSVANMGFVRCGSNRAPPEMHTTCALQSGAAKKSVRPFRARWSRV